MTVTVKKVGGSLAVILPAVVARAAQLTEGVALEMDHTADSITMRRTRRRPRRSIVALAQQIDAAAYRRRRAEFANDVPVGKEIG